MAHHRLFVALHPPPAIRAAIRAVQGGIAGARWQTDEQLHCTLRFLGEQNGQVAEDIAVALSGLHHPAIEARLEGLGCFAHKGRADSLWVGIGPISELRALHDKVDRLLRAAGIAPDPRAYRPHITTARLPRSLAVPEAAAAQLPAPPALAFRFTEVRLYESLLGRDGARYAPVLRLPLGPDAAL
ncbi:RNA 2',3'-cyclic phosphodiesterase [Sphingomonas morindae]|uniref:RNA 2',3'-cyclic phosphodiesterase n=1 Tax=Sphingomonas morindae TaxID=1541170 RepID=A0ABY4X3N2_9SPHN|nr:RNA 2',3'-cyclic phosphodiesterase [Sphingomonas morindae]USI71482.1 RNA 2',3'-cyclic phosphodiesterase [Sphingomonas morindae]